MENKLIEFENKLKTLKRFDYNWEGAGPEGTSPILRMDFVEDAEGRYVEFEKVMEIIKELQK